MATFNIVAMGDGSYGIVSSANVSKTKDEAVAYITKHCRTRKLVDRPAQGEEASDAEIASIGRRLAEAFNKWGQSSERGVDKQDFKEVLVIATELCRACHDEEAFEQVDQQAAGDQTNKNSQLPSQAVNEEAPQTARRGERERLPNRRRSETFPVENNGLQYTVTHSPYADGRLAEIFLNCDKAGSQADAAAKDSAVVASIALQYGAPVEVIAKALLRDERGVASSPLGAALDRLMAEEKTKQEKSAHERQVKTEDGRDC